jgi:hypothetical protein
MKTIALAAITAGAVVAIGCESNGPPVELGSEESFDGLVRVENASAVWIDRDFDLSGFSQVKLEGVRIEYRDVADTPRRAVRTARSQEVREIPLSEDDKAQLRDMLDAAFRTELGRSERFELTEQAGPGVLQVQVELLDVVAFVPGGARGELTLDSAGEATLVLELRDSQTNATLARIVDRRAATRDAGGPIGFRPTAATGPNAVRQLVAAWASLLRRRLDAAPTLHEGVVVQ